MMNQKHDPRWRIRCHALVWLAVALVSGCSQLPISAPRTVAPANARDDAVLTPGTRISRELMRLPAPEYRIPVGVYAFRDQTGQFKPQPDSNLSAAVTQGAASLLVKTLLESGWFIPVEREGLQNLLTERRVARAVELPGDRGRPGSSFPQLLAANYLIEGGIVGYEQNVRTGGEGANYLGIGADVKYLVDQVTINLRSVDVRTSQVLSSVSITKTIYSHSLSGSINTFVAWKTLLQTEGGFTSNEPGQLAVKQAIESGVVHLILQGLRYGAWNLQQPQDWFNPVLQAYAREAEALQTGLDLPANAVVPLPRPMAEAMVLPAQKPQHLLVPYKTTEPQATPAQAMPQPALQPVPQATPPPAPQQAPQPTPQPVPQPAPLPDNVPPPVAPTLQSGAPRSNATGITGLNATPQEPASSNPAAVPSVTGKSVTKAVGSALPPGGTSTAL